MNKHELDQWYTLFRQWVNGYHLSDTDTKELIRLNHLVMEASHAVHNNHMLQKEGSR